MSSFSVGRWFGGKCGRGVRRTFFSTPVSEGVQEKEMHFSLLGPAVKTLPGQPFLKFLDHHGDSLEEVRHNTIGSDFEDGSLRILINGDDDI